MTQRLILADCLEAMKDMADNSVDLIATDPPYFRVKAEAWDRQWAKPEAFLEWIGELCAEWQRILKPNGSLYVFASPQMSARVEVEIGKRFQVLNGITWSKKDKAGNGIANRSDITTFRGYFPQSERIIFAEHFGADNIAKGEAGYEAKCDELRGFVFEPLRAYLDGERIAAGFDRGMCDKACGNQMSGHYFSRVQWTLPTRANYEKLQQAFGGVYLRREYEDLRREYEDLRREYEDLRRPFAVTADVPYTDVWTFPTVQAYKGKHPCEKPLALMEHIISASSRQGAVVLDCFMGSGTTGVAARNLGRSFIGIEKDERWLDVARRRIESPSASPKPVCLPRPLPLFDGIAA